MSNQNEVDFRQLEAALLTTSPCLPLISTIKQFKPAILSLSLFLSFVSVFVFVFVLVLVNNFPLSASHLNHQTIQTNPLKEDSGRGENTRKA